MEKANHIFNRIKTSVEKNIRYATCQFIFIIFFIQVFQTVFGPENSIAGVIFAIMMSASMLRDLTARPVKHFLVQAAVFISMAAAACFVSNADPFLALPLNFAMLFFILYAFTYEYVSHLYFPYILSYLFLVFISPVPPEQLPKRLAAMVAGAGCIMLYQLYYGRKRVVETAHDVLGAMIDEAGGCIRCLISSEGRPQDPEKLRSDLCKLSRIVYERRRRVLCISSASFAMIDCGRGLENLVLLLYEMEGPVTKERAARLSQISGVLGVFRAFLNKEIDTIPPFERADFEGADTEANNLFLCLSYIREHMLKMTHPTHQSRYHKTLLSFSVRLKAALAVSPVRVVYALRISALLAACTLLVQHFALPHGRWLLFTAASVSLPYADDVGTKAKKRLIATLTGGLISLVFYALVPSPAGRTAAMMLSGYLSFFFSDYSATFACSTVGALGGAVFMESFGWSAVGTVFAIRLGYILLGAAVALVINCVLFPFHRKAATKQLWEKFKANIALLTNLCQQDQIDPQLYYSLVIQVHLQENQLYANAKALNWHGAHDQLDKCRKTVRLAHRKRQYVLENT